MPNFLQFLPYSQLIVSEIPKTEHFDVLVVLDCGELDRIGRAVQSLRQATKIIHIDHHSTGNDFGQLNLVKPESSSTAEILYDIFQAIPTALDVDVAENLYTAILTDTGSFRFANTTEKSLVIAAEMVGLGVVPEKVAAAAKVVYRGSQKGPVGVVVNAVAGCALKDAVLVAYARQTAYVRVG